MNPENSILWRIKHNSISYIKNYLVCKYYNLLKRNTFSTGENKYNYFYHTHNRTWRSERSIEIPIIWKILLENGNKSILEVGNVLSQYYPICHDVIDKYEIAEEVINEDVVDYKPNKKYDIIVSISTLEHVGWDDGEEKEPDKILKAIDNLKYLLTETGFIIFTAPLGYNPYLDSFIKNNKINFHKTYFMKRISANEWIESCWNDIENTKFNEPYTFANGLIIGIIKK